MLDRIDPFTGASIDANANRLLSNTARVALALAPSDSVRIAPSLTYESFPPRRSLGYPRRDIRSGQEACSEIATCYPSPPTTRSTWEHSA
jgi:hypothetical protein